MCEKKLEGSDLEVQIDSVEELERKAKQILCVARKRNKQCAVPLAKLTNHGTF